MSGMTKKWLKKKNDRVDVLKRSPFKCHPLGWVEPQNSHVFEVTPIPGDQKKVHRKNVTVGMGWDFKVTFLGWVIGDGFLRMPLGMG